MIQHPLICGNNESFDTLVGDQYVLFKNINGGITELWLYDYIRPNNRTMLIKNTKTIQYININNINVNFPFQSGTSFYFIKGHKIYIGIDNSSDKKDKLILKCYDLKINSTKPCKKEEYSFTPNQSSSYLCRKKLFYQNLIIDIDTFELTYLIPCTDNSRHITNCSTLYYVTKGSNKLYYTIDTNTFVIEINGYHTATKNDTWIFLCDNSSSNNSNTQTYKFVRKELETRTSTDVKFISGKINIRYSPKIFDIYEVKIDDTMTKLPNLENLYDMINDAINRTDPMISYEILPNGESYIFELRDNHKYHKMVEQFKLEKVPDEVTIDNKLNYVLERLDRMNH